MTSDEYLAAFMGGFEFVLLGMQGRLHDARLDAEARESVLRFIEDYQRIVLEYRQRNAPAMPETVSLVGLVPNRN